MVGWVGVVGGVGRGWEGVGEGGKGWEGVGYSRMKQLNECHYARLCKLTRATVLSISHAPWEHVFRPNYSEAYWNLAKLTIADNY